MVIYSYKLIRVRQVRARQMRVRVTEFIDSHEGANDLASGFWPDVKCGKVLE